VGETPATCPYGLPHGGSVVAPSFAPSDSGRGGCGRAVGARGAERIADGQARRRDSACTGKADAHPSTPSAKGVVESRHFAVVSARGNSSDQGELQPQLHLGTQRKQNLQAGVLLRV